MAGGYNNFDDDDGFDLRQNDNGQQDLGDSEYGDFGQSSQGSNLQVADGSTQDKSGLIKICVIIIVIAIMIIAIVFKVVGGSGKSKNKPKDTVVAPNTQQIEQVNNNNTSSNSSNSNDGWVSISGKDSISFSENEVSSTFTITAIKHYAKVVDSNKNLEVKTVLTGTLDGFTGTYDLEVPYSKGCRLSVTQNFSVKVEVGDYNGKTVIGDIKY